MSAVPTKPIYAKPPARAAAPALPAPKRMTLSAITTGKLDLPLRVVIYGVEGIGKSTFAADAPKPIVLDADGSTARLDVARFPKPETWLDVLDAVSLLTNEQHDYQSLVLDTADAIEPLCWEHVCSQPDERNKRHKSIVSFGYGKGYDRALDHWRVLTAALERLQQRRGMHVIIVAHNLVKTFKNPEGEDYDRYSMKMNEKAAGFFREWSYATLFAQYETFTAANERGRIQGKSTGARVLRTQRSAAYDAKNRYDLPATLPLSWDAFIDAVGAGTPINASTLRTRIEGLLASAPDLHDRVMAAVQRAGDDAAQLAKISDKLTADVSIRAQNAQEGIENNG